MFPITVPRLFPVTMAQFFSSGAGTIVPRGEWHHWFEVTPPQLLPSEKLNWHDCSQVKLARLLPSETDTFIAKRRCLNFYKVILAQLLPSEIGTIVPKWDWQDCSQVRLARVFESDFDFLTYVLLYILSTLH